MLQLRMPKFHKKNAKKSGKNSKKDNESVDSKGNIRDLIDYDYEEETDSDYIQSSSDEEEVFEMEGDQKRVKRKAAVKAQKAIRKIIEKPTIKKGKGKVKEKTKVSDEDEDESDDDIDESEDEDESDDDIDESDDEDDTDDDIDESEDESDESEDETMYKRPAKRMRKNTKGEDDSPTFDIVLSDILGSAGGKDPLKPVKYNMKKEPASVKRFVELLQTEEAEVDNIDKDITYFKSLTIEKQNQLLTVLEHKASPAEVIVPIKFKILEKVAIKPTLQRIAMAKYNALCNIDPSSTEYYKCQHWINGFTSLPLGLYKDLPVKLEDGPEKCGEFMVNVRKCMDQSIYGHDDAKLQIMQFISSWIANPSANGNIMSIHGPPGIGKTRVLSISPSTFNFNSSRFVPKSFILFLIETISS